MRVKTFLAVILTALLCLAVFPALAQGTAGGSFPEGVIEVPKGTQVAIHPDESVTITDCPVQIQAGDTYVVYLQDLPMGYIAEKVTTEGNRTTITGPHAEADIYSGLKESGTIVLTSDMFDVQAGTLRGDPSFSLLGLVEYEDGKVTFTIGDSTTGGLRTSVKVTYSNLAVNFAINDLNMSASLSGDWEVTLSGGTGGTPLGEIPVGEIRVFGVGKIALKINFSFEVNATFGGSFSSGFAIENMHGRLTRSFSTSKMEGEGRVNLSLKLTAGLDFVVASADVFAEIGVQTVQKGKLTYHEDREPHEVRCTDFKVYMFLKVGAEAHYAKQELGKVEFPVWDGDSSPAMLNVHIENGTKVDRCSEGMDTTTIEESFDGSVSDFETISETLGERYVYKKVIMPFDYVVDGSMYVEDGGIDLNGYQLTVNGDLIQSGGEIKVGDGQLTVTGDYYMVRDLIDDNPRQYGDSLLTFEEGSAAVSGKLVQAEGKVEIKRGTLTVGGNYEMHREYGENRYIDSTGCLVMQSSDGSLTIGGDLVLQSHSSGHILTAGTIHLAGNLMQSRTLEGTSHFQCLWEHTLDLLPGYEHALYFDDAQNNSLSVLSFADDLVANSSISIGHMDLGGHHFVIHGDLIKNNSANTYQVQDFILNGGTLDVDGSFYQTNGQVSLDGGKLNVGGDYIIASGASDYVNKVYETIYRDGICMNQPQDEAHIGGDFICAGERGTSLSDGVLYIGGDLQDFCGSFSAWNNHRTVMNGSGVQALTFRHPNAGFNIVEFQNKNIRLNGPWLRGFTLNDDLQLVLGTDTLQLNGVVDLNGHTLGIQQINGSFTLTGWDGAKLILGGYPLTITGDLKLGADLNLSGGTLNVQGNIHQQYGMISQDGGQLNVGGNYVAASWQSDYANKEYSSVYYAGIGMMQAQDEARIGGDFICTSQVGCNLSEGTLYIGGDLEDFQGNFSARNNHRTVLDGSGVQALTFRDQKAMFNIVEFRNSSIRLNGPWLHGFTLNDDLQLILGTDTLQLNGVVDLNGHTLGIQQINGSFTLTGWDGAKLILGGYPLTITGDLKLKADLALSGGTLNVQGNIHQSYGQISLDGGKLNVAGNYVAATWQSDYANKEYESTYYAGIGMSQAQDEARIGGDFIIASDVGTSLSDGTLYIGGDFEDFSGNFSARNNHRTVMNGSGAQALTFRNIRGGFATLELLQMPEQYSFNRAPCWDELILAQIPAFGPPDFMLPESLEAIEEAAFESVHTTAVEIPESCLRIGAYAFRNSTVRRIRFPASCEIDDTTFEDCGLILFYAAPGSTAEAYCSTHRNCIFVQEGE